MKDLGGGVSQNDRSTCIFSAPIPMNKDLTMMWHGSPAVLGDVF